MVKAFRSSIDEFDEHNNSITSAQSMHSMRGYRAHLAAAAEVNHKRSSVCSLLCRTSSPQPYPYFHSRYGQQQKISGEYNSLGITTTDNHRLKSSPQYSPVISPSPASSASPQAVIVENGRHFAADRKSTGIANNNNPLTVLFSTSNKDAQERIPLVIKYEPGRGTTTTKSTTANATSISITSPTPTTAATSTVQPPLIVRSSQSHMGKSYSPDAPVSIAHV